MLAIQKVIGKDSRDKPVLEDDRCFFVLKKNDKGDPIYCHTRAGFKCDRCKEWRCSEHLHYRCEGKKSEQEDICHTCIPVEVIEFNYQVPEGKRYITKTAEIEFPK